MTEYIDDYDELEDGDDELKIIDIEHDIESRNNHLMEDVDIKYHNKLLEQQKELKHEMCFFRSKLESEQNKFNILLRKIGNHIINKYRINKKLKTEYYNYITFGNDMEIFLSIENKIEFRILNKKIKNKLDLIFNDVLLQEINKVAKYSISTMCKLDELLNKLSSKYYEYHWVE